MSAIGRESALELDREARLLAQREFRRPLVLVAGAGTGKTAALVARVLAWSLGPGWNAALKRCAPGAPDHALAHSVLERVCAITFTDKAAAEMEQRLGAALLALLDAADESAAVKGFDPTLLGLSKDVLHRRCESLLLHIERLPVSTIHAFCAGMLREHALAAGLHPAFEIDSEGTRLRQLARELVGETLAKAYGSPGEPDALLLAQHELGPESLLEALIELARAGVPASGLERDPYPADEVGQWLEAIGEAAAHARGLLHATLPQRNGRLKKAIEARDVLDQLVLELERGSKLDSLCQLARTESLLSAQDRLDKWRDSDFGDTESNALGSRARELQRDCSLLAPALDALRRMHPELLRAAWRTLAPLLGELDERRRRSGLMTFQDLLCRAERLLRERTDVRARVARGMDQLLVDEFQDTDALQCSILERLALEGPEDERPGLFLVGDPKQSLYAWRGADLRAFESFLSRCTRAGGSRHTLVANYRSCSAVLDEVGRLCAPVMSAEPGLQWPFEPLYECRDAEHGRPASLNGSPAIEHACSWSAAPDREAARTSADEARAIEARAIAADLRALHARGLPWKHAALLLRSTSPLETYLDALRGAGIPFAVQKEKNFYQRREIQDAANLVLAALEPGDALALAGALRTPWIGVPDAALEPLWSAGLPERMAGWSRAGEAERAEVARLVVLAERAVAAIPDAAGLGMERIAGWPLALAQGLLGLLELRACYASEGADRFIEMLRALFLPEESEAARYLGHHRQANLELFFGELEQALCQSLGGPREVLRELRERARDAQDSTRGAAAAEEHEAVSVLTIHSAKGLEWPVVYLPNLHAKAPSRSHVRTRVAWDGTRLEVDFHGLASLGWQAVEQHQSRLAEAETARLLYVAATRAMDRLVLLGAWPAAGEGAGDEPLMRLLLQREGGRPDFERALREGAYCDTDGVCWSCPDVKAVSAVLPAPGAEATRVEQERALGDARAESLALALARSAARTRELRPRTAGVTAGLDTAEREQEHVVCAEPGMPTPAGRGRERAQLAGSAVHRALEQWDLAAPVEDELRRQLDSARAWLARTSTPADAGPVFEETRALLASLRDNGLLQRLRQLGPHLLARELPLLEPPSAEAGPVLARTGRIDLFYRDPDSAELVVADYKTDRVASEPELAEQAARHGLQARAYGAAVQRALGHPARCELWFLRSGRVQRLDSSPRP